MEREFIGKTAYITRGHGKPVVLIHGVGMNADFWTPQLECLSHIGGLSVIAIDMLGHGESAPPPQQATFADYREQMNNVLDSLQLWDATLVGHSLGGLVAIAAAHSRPQRVSRLVALNAVYRRSASAKKAVLARAKSVEQNNIVTLDEPISRWFGEVPPPEQEANVKKVSKFLMTINPRSYAAAYRVFADNDWHDEEQLSQLTMPTLFMSGEEDKNSTPAMAAEMAKLSGGKNLTVWGAGHMMPLTAAETVNKALLDFMVEHGNI